MADDGFDDDAYNDAIDAWFGRDVTRPQSEDLLDFLELGGDPDELFVDEWVTLFEDAAGDPELLAALREMYEV